MTAFLFAYGSLMARPGFPGSRPCRLMGHRRVWNVAMDNRETVAGYKYYRYPGDRQRPELFVAFLNIVPRRDSAVNGAVLDVSEHKLAALDARERNYRRRAVTAEIDLELDGPVWAYAGTSEARERYEAAAAHGRAVVSREYLDQVLESFRAAGPEALAEFEATTDPPGCPVLELERVEVGRGPAS